MCTTCGCGDETNIRVSTLQEAGGPLLPEQPHVHSHDHEHPHTHGHEHSHDHAHPYTHDHPHDHTPEIIPLEQSLLHKNEVLAARNRGWLEGRGIRALNVMSSPGAGKTTLLVRTLADLGEQLRAGVVEGDQETCLDADRIRAVGRPVVQINTGAGCHLDADMLKRGLDALDPEAGSTVFIENVGNLVCPALFDLGEAAKVVVVSVTEGDDKPQKYPHMFRAADLVVINKSDLLPYVDFDVDRFQRRARQINSRTDFLVLSASTGDGLTGWYDWLGGTGSRSSTLTESLTDTLSP